MTVKSILPNDLGLNCVIYQRLMRRVTMFATELNRQYDMDDSADCSADG